METYIFYLHSKSGKVNYLNTVVMTREYMRNTFIFNQFENFITVLDARLVFVGVITGNTNTYSAA